MAPSNRYSPTERTASLGLKTVAISPIAKFCRVKGTGPMGILIWANTAIRAAPIAGMA